MYRPTEQTFSRFIDPRLDRASMTWGNQVQLLCNGEQVFPAMLGAIDSARQRVDQIIYTFRPDHIGEQFTDAFVAAAGRGCKVRVAYDAAGCWFQSREHFRRLRRAGVEVYAINPIIPRESSQLWHPIVRDHRKLLTVDDRIGFVGGLNIGDEYTGHAQDKLHWRDNAVQIVGPAAVYLRRLIDVSYKDSFAMPHPVAAASAAKADDLNGWHGHAVRVTMFRPETSPIESTHGHANSVTMPPTSVVLPPTRQMSEHGQAGIQPDHGTQIGTQVGGTQIGVPVWIHSPEPFDLRRIMHKTFAAIVQNARRYVWIMSAYFAPNYPLVAEMKRAVRRGVDVRLILPQHTDIPIIRWVSHAWYDRLISGGVRVFERSLSVLHAKAVVADDEVSLIGSANIDARSMYLNREVMAEIFDPAFAVQVRAMFAADLAASHEVELHEFRRRHPIRRLKEFAAYVLSPML